MCHGQNMEFRGYGHPTIMTDGYPSIPYPRKNIHDHLFFLGESAMFQHVSAMITHGNSLSFMAPNSPRDIVVQELPTEDVQRTAYGGIHPARAWEFIDIRGDMDLWMEYGIWMCPTG